MSKRYNYKVLVAGKNPVISTVGRGTMKAPHSVTVHHSGTSKTNNPIATIKAINKYKKGYFPYHIYITSDDGPIYITQWLDDYTYHNNNFRANKDSIAVCVDGNYNNYKPSKRSAEKLKQVLDDLHNNWFRKEGWINFAKNLKVKNKKSHSYDFGKKVYTLHWHAEVAKNGNSTTSCCGNYLKTYIKDYRNKGGKVSWGSTDISNNTQVTIKKLKERVKLLKSENGKLKSMEGNLIKEVEGLKKELTAQRTTGKELKAELKMCKEEVTKIKEDKKGLQKDNKKLEKELGKTKDAWEESLEGVQKIANKEISKLERKLEECRKSKTVLSDYTAGELIMALYDKLGSILREYVNQN